MTTQRDTFDRRTVLKMAAVGVASTALAGCSGDAGGSGDDSGGDGSGGDDSSGSSGDYDFGGWFDDVENYDGVADETGADEVTVMVGAEGNGGGFAFGPAAVAVSTGTTVVWEWTGDGDAHNVVAEDGSFESEQVTEAGHTFEHTFEETGTYEYVCVPHEAMGMKGAIVVE
ncbi:halocyanin domain-containing protein [Halorussus amylolyticus]|uniref:halocyanin domain-containing protein n=1 Tax=Halorussus amylolyticus TaxID=1126242 RepID=UPI00104E654E|nr:halocyanin domain-containing protein [Halorussus amylolyticus]